MRHRLPFAAPVLALLFALACGGGRGDDRALPGAPIALFEIGRGDGAQWESFGHVGHVAFDADDNLYVLDQAASVVYVYGADGRFRNRIGRPGRGPGELAAPMQVAVASEGEVVVSDLEKRAFSVFDRSGRHLR